MFDKLKFQEILNNIISKYDSVTQLAEESDVSRTYISQYSNLRLDKAPAPNILRKIANNSKGITDYNELMLVCGHLENNLEGVSDKTFIECFNKMEDLNEKELEIIKGLSSNIELVNANKKDDFSNILNNILHTYNLSSKSKLKILNTYKILLLSVKERFDYDSNKELTPIKIPVIGKISAGMPILAEENFEGYEFAPFSSVKDGYEYFYLRVNGDSMNTKFNDGDLVLVQKQEFLENGEIGVIRINGYDATVKRFKKQDDIIILEPMSNNTEHHVQIYNTKDVDVNIIGKVVSYIGKI